MTRADLLMLFYGLSAWGAALNFPAWARLMVWRLKEIQRPEWQHDSILFMRSGLTLLSFGIMGIAGVRLSGALFGGVPIAVPSPLGVAFIAAMATAETFFLRVDEIHSQARGSHSIGWRIYWIGAVAMMTVFAVDMMRGGR